MEKHQDCRYCTRGTDIMEEVADLEVSVLYAMKDQAYRGRCIIAAKDHVTEVFKLGDGAAAFGRDLARASKAIYEAFSPDKINYATYGDSYPHLHMHLVPKYKGGKSWGGPFDLAPDPAGFVSENELKEIIKKLRDKLGVK